MLLEVIELGVIKLEVKKQGETKLETRILGDRQLEEIAKKVEVLGAGRLEERWRQGKKVVMRVVVLGVEVLKT